MKIGSSIKPVKPDDTQPLLPSTKSDISADKTFAGRTVKKTEAKSTSIFNKLSEIFSKPESKSIYKRKISTADFQSYYTKPKINTSGIFSKRTTFNAKAAVSHLNADQINKKWTASIFSEELKKYTAISLTVIYIN